MNTQQAMNAAFQALNGQNLVEVTDLVAKMAELGHREFILNLTQHAASEEQLAAGVYDDTKAKHALTEMLTFHDQPSRHEVRVRADCIARIAERRGVKFAMIGGAPYLMAELERELHDRGIAPLYAFSRRESVEETLPDGSVRKVAEFRHLGFV